MAERTPVAELDHQFSDHIDQGVDVVVEGDAVRVTDEPKLRRVADAYASKYGDPFTFSVGDGAFLNDEGGTAR